MLMCSCCLSVLWDKVWDGILEVELEQIWMESCALRYVGMAQKIRDPRSNRRKEDTFDRALPFCPSPLRGAGETVKLLC